MKNQWFRRRWAGPVVMTLAMLLRPAVGAQDQPASNQAEPAQQTAQPAAQPAESVGTVSTELTKENIQTLIGQIEADKDMLEAAKAEALSLCRQALEQNSLADNWAAKTAEYKRGREETPNLLQDARNSLAEATARAEVPPVPEVPPGARLEELAQREAEADADLKEQRKKLSDLESEMAGRQDLMTALPGFLADAKARLASLGQELGLPPAEGVPPKLVLARQASLTSRERAVTQEIQAYEEQRRFLEARRDLLTARLDEARLNVAHAEAHLGAWQALVNERRQAEVEQQKRQAQEELERTPQVIRELAEQNRKLAEDRAELARRIDTVQQETKSILETSAELRRAYEKLSKMVSQPALADVIGPQLRQARDKLNNLRYHERDYLNRKRELNTVQLTRAQLEDDRSALADIQVSVQNALAGLAGSVPPAQLQRLEGDVRALFVSRREAIDALLQDHQTYPALLSDLVAAQAQLLTQVADYREFIDKHVMWLPSAAPVYRLRFPPEWSVIPQTAAALYRATVPEVRRHAARYTLALLAFGLLLAARPALRSELRAAAERVARPRTDSYRLTLLSLPYTVLLALPWPSLLWVLGGVLTGASEFTEGAAYEVALARGVGLRTAGALLFLILLVWNVCRSSGLAECHFRWDEDALRRVRRNLTWFTPVVLLLTIVVASTEARYPQSPWRDSVGRFAFMAAMLAVAALAHRLVQPNTGVFAKWYGRHRDGWASRLRHIWYTALLVTPLILALAAAAGYQYTAVQLAIRLIYTVGLLLALLILHALLTRAVLVAQRRIAIEQAEERRAAQAEAKITEPESGKPSAPIEESALDLVTIGAQTRKLLRAVIAFTLVIGVWVTWADLLPALSFMDDVRLWSYMAESAAEGAEGEAVTARTIAHITMQNVVVALLIVIATVVLARNIPGLLEITVLQRLRMDAGGRFAAATLARYLIVVLGLVLAFNEIGIGWSKVQWLAAAITVGLGFGLQEIFANLVSGLILLFERPIRIGDTVTVGDITGTVTRMRIRATTITDWNRKELVIPNKEFVVGQVVNWTLSDPILRCIIPVGIAYGSDTKLAEQVLHRVVDEEPLVLKEPRPRVHFLGFGDSSLNFEVRAFIDSIDQLLNVKHALHMAIDREFRRAGIEIAFPQRDIHVRSIHAALPIETGGGATRPVVSVDTGSASAD